MGQGMLGYGPCDYSRDSQLLPSSPSPLLLSFPVALKPQPNLVRVHLDLLGAFEEIEWRWYGIHRLSGSAITSLYVWALGQPPLYGLDVDGHAACARHTLARVRCMAGEAAVLGRDPRALLQPLRASTCLPCPAPPALGAEQRGRQGRAEHVLPPLLPRRMCRSVHHRACARWGTCRGGGYLSDLAMSATLTMSATPITISDLNSLSELFTPPTHLQSALSVASDTSHFVLHNKGEATAHPITNNPPTKYLPFQMTMETIRQHKGQCLLCGQKDNLTVMRTILQHGVGTEQLDPISWLQGLKALPVEYTCDEWTNLMTLCKPHARVYEDNVWWWVPSTALRAHMANLVPISGAATPSHATSEDGEADEMDEGEDSEAHGPYSPSEFISGITIDDGISGQMHNPEIRRSKEKEDAEVQARRVVILAGRVAEGDEDENTDLDVGLR
ncbi:uncharacterized protein BXZ73DRAFT_83115 [Epithele typhae]|uniref:uncharacterized protein n=1 Tax=Epithele typhae TaxID=378194 RepID=UPI0020075EF6|nr:uncharacterized protein BXZ73DRAFT_83115 [Epithele typhae]KAH9910848.1 hypothetical protein BXZ73DRAFT_83115 [Epithele typhae]